MSTPASVLEPLAARYAQWMGRPAAAVVTGAAPVDEDPARVRAMQIVLRVERSPLPSRTALLEASAASAVAVCLDPRSAPGGEWHDAVAAWATGRIRKVSRRARGVHWHAVQPLPGLTVTAGAAPPVREDVASRPTYRHDATSSREPEPEPEPAVAGAEVRALVPGLVAELPREVSRLQVGGTDLPADDPGPPVPDLPTLWLNPAVPMTVGKAAAQVGHATMIAAALLAASGEQTALESWAVRGYAVSVRTPPLRLWAALHSDINRGDDPLNAWRRRRVLAVRDGGFTEVAPGTVTVLAQLPG